MLVEAGRDDFLRAIESREAEVARQLAFLRRFFTPRSVFLHRGAADALLAVQAASYVERVYAHGVVEGLTAGVPLPLNLRLGPAREPVDIAFGERLEPQALGAIRAALAAGGRYFFQVHGDYREAREHIRAAGFREIRFPYFVGFFHRQRIAAALR